MEQAAPSDPVFCQKVFSQKHDLKGSSGPTPPSSLSEREHSLILSCVPTLRGAEAKKPIGRQGQNGKHEMGSNLRELSPKTRPKKLNSEAILKYSVESESPEKDPPENKGFNQLQGQVA